MGRSSADAEVRPKNSAECSARFGSATWDYSAEVQSNFSKHSASLGLRIGGVLRSPLALTNVNTLTI